MKVFALAIIGVFSISGFSQKTFDLKNASKYFDVSVKVAKCDNDFCEGKARFSFFKKRGGAPYQVIELPDTEIWLDKSGNAQTNNTLLYDEQSVINVGDFNFDGMEDVAICDGTNGSYGMPSYRVYLSSKKAGKFVYSGALSKLGRHLGMFTVDKAKKTLETFDKSGCCWHITERYAVKNNRPVKVFEEVEDATSPDLKKVKITTKRLVNGRWVKSVRMEKRID